ncbi:23S rRNA (adenine(2030)-N(6))-methyltransferase RlmJ [Paraglaciecola aestuariivivens]
MLSYRHSYHAGNHGDVLKHLSQMLLIEKLKSKQKGFYYFDTHSGAGVYQLDSAEAQKTNEFKLGINKLKDYQAQHPALIAYLNLVKSYQQFGQYPGSPELAKSLLRQQDAMVLMEKHNQEILNLKSNIGGKNIAVHHRDGYEGLVALTPPKLPRGLVLIDPSYEVAEEYDKLVETVVEVNKKWPAAIIAIWYPILASRQASLTQVSSAQSKAGKSQTMLNTLASKPIKNLLQVELCVTSKAEGEGMVGSGMAVINAPWQFDQQIEQCLQEVCPLLALNPHASYLVDWLIQDS